MDFLTDIIGDWLSGLGNVIGDMSGNISDLLSSIVGIIPRSIVFIRSLFTPIHEFIDTAIDNGITNTIFGVSATSILFFSVIGFIIALAIRRGITK